ncbi:MAG: transposase [Planctomycetota bacterium]
MSNSTRHSVLFPDLAKPTVVEFDSEATSSAGGLVLLRQLDDRLGLSASLAGELGESRQEGKIQHSMLDLVRQRVFGIALGYADCKNGTRLRHDGMFKLGLDRDPVNGREIASHPVLSRFENAVRGPDLLRAMRHQEENVLDRFAHNHRHARRVVLDFDGTGNDTEDKTHGQQFFSGFK